MSEHNPEDDFEEIIDYQRYPMPVPDTRDEDLAEATDEIKRLADDLSKLKVENERLKLKLELAMSCTELRLDEAVEILEGLVEPATPNEDG